HEPPRQPVLRLVAPPHLLFGTDVGPPLLAALAPVLAALVGDAALEVARALTGAAREDLDAAQLHHPDEPHDGLLRIAGARRRRQVLDARERAGDVDLDGLILVDDELDAAHVTGDVDDREPGDERRLAQ